MADKIFGIYLEDKTTSCLSEFYLEESSKKEGNFTVKFEDYISDFGNAAPVPKYMEEYYAGVFKGDYELCMKNCNLEITASNAESLTSFSLAMFSTMLKDQINSEKVIITGNLGFTGSNLVVKEVFQCQEKYDKLVNCLQLKGDKSEYAFYYVSSSEIKKNDSANNISLCRIEPESLVQNFVSILTSRAIFKDSAGMVLFLKNKIEAEKPECNSIKFDFYYSMNSTSFGLQNFSLSDYIAKNLFSKNSSKDISLKYHLLDVKKSNLKDVRRSTDYRSFRVVIEVELDTLLEAYVLGKNETQYESHFDMTETPTEQPSDTNSMLFAEIIFEDNHSEEIVFISDGNVIEFTNNVSLLKNEIETIKGQFEQTGKEEKKADRFVLSGYPGVGKSTVISAYLRKENPEVSPESIELKYYSSDDMINNRYYAESESQRALVCTEPYFYDSRTNIYEQCIKISEEAAKECKKIEYDAREHAVIHCLRQGANHNKRVDLGAKETLTISVYRLLRQLGYKLIFYLDSDADIFQRNVVLKEAGIKDFEDYRKKYNSLQEEVHEAFEQQCFDDYWKKNAEGNPSFADEKKRRNIWQMQCKCLNNKCIKCNKKGKSCLTDECPAEKEEIKSLREEFWKDIFHPRFERYLLFSDMILSKKENIDATVMELSRMLGTEFPEISFSREKYPEYMFGQVNSFAQMTRWLRFPDIFKKILDDDFNEYCENHSAGEYIYEKSCFSFDDYLEKVKDKKLIDFFNENEFLEGEFLFYRILEKEAYGSGRYSEGEDYFFDKYKEKDFNSDLILEKSEELSDSLILTSTFTIDKLTEILHMSLNGNHHDLSQSRQYKDRYLEENNSQVKLLSSQICPENPEIKELYKYLSERKHDRIDVLLDNAGPELMSDIVMAMIFLSCNVCKEIHLHGKSKPVFVSDATQSDLKQILDFLEENGHSDLRKLIVSYEKEKRLCFHFDERDMCEEPDFRNCTFFKDIEEGKTKTSLIISKGDLNMRRLIGDRKYPSQNPIRPMIGYIPTRVLFLRIIKSELMAGLTDEEAKLMNDINQSVIGNEKYPVPSMTKGEYGMIKFV